MRKVFVTMSEMMRICAAEPRPAEGKRLHSAFPRGSLLALVLFPGLFLLFGEDTREQIVASPSSNQRWIEIDRGETTREALWIEEGGRIDYVQYTNGRILARRHGIMPGGRYRKILRSLDDVGLLPEEGLIGGSSASDPDVRCRITINAGQRTDWISCGDSSRTSAQVQLINDLFRFPAGLAPSRESGVFVRVGAPVWERPPGLSRAPDAGSPDDRASDLSRRLLRQPGRFVHLGEDGSLLESGRFPRDNSGNRWIQDGDGWRPLPSFLLEPSSE